MIRFLLLVGLFLGFFVETSAKEPPANPSKDAVEALREFLKIKNAKGLDDEPFASVPLSKEDAEQAKNLLWKHYLGRVQKSRSAELEANEIRAGKHKLPIWYKTYGDKPEGGHSLWISLHGGGGAPARVNDRQWQNQKRLYELEEGIYLAPRAPTNTWNLWHQGHIDQLFDRLIETFIVLKDVDPNRVYVLGYSAGGDGVYQIAPRMADRWAAASMMAGHPNEASPLGLRNIGFGLFVGGRDGAYNRNAVAADWKARLAELQKQDPDGYRHLAKIYPDKGHWMGGLDQEALPWMAKFDRNPIPKRIVWKQDDVTRKRFYWLAVSNPKPGTEISAHRQTQNIHIDGPTSEGLCVRLNDDMLNLDQAVYLTIDQKTKEHLPTRRIEILWKTMEEYGDPHLAFSAEINCLENDAAKGTQ